MGFIPWAPIGGSGSRSLSNPGNALEAEGKRHNVSVVQLALAWLLEKSPVMLPIPGTSSLAYLEENMAAASTQLRSATAGQARVATANPVRPSIKPRAEKSTRSKLRFRGSIRRSWQQRALRYEFPRIVCSHVTVFSAEDNHMA